MPVLDQFGSPIAPSRVAQRSDYVTRYSHNIRARYDAAQTTDENERHWANADYLGPNTSALPATRRKLRSRARYEAQENNSYAKGMILTLANDLIGTGPRLQLLTKDRAANQRVERSFGRWADEIGLAEKLRTMRVVKAVDGESFCMLGSNDRLEHPVKLDVRPFEADYVETPCANLFPAERQGIRFDEFGNPTAYYIFREHPGDGYPAMQQLGDWIDAKQIIHLFRCDRPGQQRGVTEIATALPLFAMLRRFTLATLAAAETAADFAAVMRTSANATTEAESLPKDGWFDAIPLEYRAMLTLPNGWDITQLKAEHPTTTYQMFKKEIINEIARCLNMPFNIAAANSADYNYASGWMDHQVYFRSVEVENSQWECRLLDRILRAWLDEAILIPGLLPMGVGPIGDWDWGWFWDGPTHVDPLKEASAQATRLANFTTTLADEFAREGKDWAEQIDQIVRERTILRDNDLNFPGTQNVPPQQADQAPATAA